MAIAVGVGAPFVYIIVVVVLVYRYKVKTSSTQVETSADRREGRVLSDTRRQSSAKYIPMIVQSWVEVTMEMGYPVGTGIPREAHGNGNKTAYWE